MNRKPKWWPTYGDELLAAYDGPPKMPRARRRAQLEAERKRKASPQLSLFGG